MRHAIRAGLMAAALLPAALAAVPAAQARPLDPNDPADAILISRKMQCSTADGEAAVYHWSGRVYSRVPGERDRHLFDVEGMNVRHCATVTDPQRGVGWRMVSRELMLYVDPVTRQPLRRWKNPWTGQDVDVVHVANDPVNSRPSFQTDAQGRPNTLRVRVENGRVFYASEVPLFYDNPLGGAFQGNVGNHYHAMEIFDFMDDERSLFDRRTRQSYPAVAWVRIAPWLPFMEMGSRPGLMVVNAMGQKLRSFDQLPAVLRNEIAAFYPAYRNPPPLDDARPNETSWTYFRKLKESNTPPPGAVRPGGQ
jgi:dipeptidyl aminopeptidase/acylaminoacyl peptidase